MTRLFVFNLPWNADSDALMAYLTGENFAVESAQVIKDKSTGQSKGYAFVEFTNEISAKSAFKAFQDGKLHLGGRKLGANEAHPKPEREKTESRSPKRASSSTDSGGSGSRRGARSGGAQYTDCWDDQD